MSIMLSSCGRRIAGGVLASSPCNVYDASASWSIVWGDVGPAHVYVPRSKRVAEQRHMPLTFRRETAIQEFESLWHNFRHDAEVPGPAERHVAAPGG